MIATITLNPSIDQYLVVPDLHKDDTNRAVSVHHFAGGKGANVSKVVRELGGPTRAHTLLGGLVGEFWKESINELNIPFSFIPVKGQTRINTVLTDLKDRTQTRVSAPGPQVSQKELKIFLKGLLKASPKPFAWALGGSLATGMPSDTYHHFVKSLQGQGVYCVLDADGEALKIGLKAKPFMIKPNEHELERLMGHSFKNLNQVAKAGRALVQKGVSVAVISLAAKGALWVTAHSAFHVSTPKVLVKSKVGAGDSLIGGFLLGLYRKQSIEKAALLGVAASTSAVMRESPRLCERKDIPKLLPKIRITALSV